MLSKTRIDRLGNRLRQGPITETDIRMLDDYQRSFSGAYEHVVRVIRDQLGLAPTGRHPKTTRSIVDKLHRESIRLSQVQDIAGCRIVVADMPEQDRVVASLIEVFPGASVRDRRADPSHGYRAVHVITAVSRQLVEIQVRTRLQHLWAELSEKCSDVFRDPEIKYGGGSEAVRHMLTTYSEMVAEGENEEALEESTRWRVLVAELLRRSIAGLKASEGQGQ